MLAALGDLVEDIAIRVDDPVNVASDTAASIDRRRGGSAANVAVMASRLGHACRFLGQVGDDLIGAALIAELEAEGVDASLVRRAGRTGTIVVLVDPTGERSMLTDRASCLALDRPSEAWLDSVTTLHVPMYSLAIDPLAATATTVIGWAHDRDVAVSIDVSSVALIEQVGVSGVLSMLDELRPSVVLANEIEAAALGVQGPLCEAITVVKQGPDPVVVFAGDDRFDVPTTPVERGADTTGAGDAFAAGFLTADWRVDLVAACRSGHGAAARALRSHR
ncbi:carbohydrate kinase family protein [Ilumatobacter sp.]|uniref:carbohydrate kinase family protein n=1 Tax=Ilumatobacter sp. TaxID=1967498 RepID=UPI003AF980C6